MCGIAGKFCLNGEPVAPGLIKAMCDRMAYRGPDDEGVFTDGHIGLGHRRLSILDLSPLGHQPMSTKDGKVWITFNGEIYNFQALRKDLVEKGYSFTSTCDTEVILYLYKEYGVECLKYMRGMFAFAIWDKDKDLLFAARDRIGKKPLFYYFDGKRFLFGSEIKCILEDPAAGKEIDYEAIYDYFKYLYIPDPKTIYKNVFKLKPGHYLTCSGQGLAIREYWDVSFSNPFDRAEDEICESLVGLLDESVSLRMISDVPLGAFLSGGIDSSMVVALMAGHHEGPVTTCSIGFDSEDYDEVKFARVIAKQFATDHHEFTVKQNVEQVLNDLAYYFDEPFADSSAVPTFYVSKVARQQVTVALAGDGGDENFAGYDKYRLDDIENRMRRFIPAFIRRSIFPPLAPMLRSCNSRVFQKGATLLKSLSFEADYGFFLTNTEVDDLLWARLVNDDTKRRIGGYNPFDITRHYYEKADTDDHLSKILYTDLKTYLPGDILVKVDRMSMANSLEVRAPILDHNVIEFAARIPYQLKYKGKEKKYILKRSLRKILPEEILYRSKMGFSVPLASWFRSEIRDLAAHHLFSPDAGLYHFFNRSAVEEIWNQHQSEARNHGTMLWSLLMFELWYQRFMR
ncbi:MAG: asparagine synthase (glutamine-hydrolyzing) [Syntrophobacteraceae bacterium]